MAPGDRIGPYEIVAPVRVDDPRTARFVARRAGDGEFARKLELTAIRCTDLSDAFARMAIDEAWYVRALSHANLAAIFDLGLADGHLFIAGELMTGGVLAELPRMPIRIATAVVAAASSGLHYLHECRTHAGELCLVHRHVSPAAIAIGFDASVKVLDAGLARPLHRLYVEDEPRAGAYAHMAPEQLAGRKLDRRADIYSLGSVLWELTVGRPRLDRGLSAFDVARAITRGSATAPSEVTADYPRELERIVMRALAQHPADRYQTMAEMHAALDELPRASPRELVDYMSRALPERAAASLAI